MNTTYSESNKVFRTGDLALAATILLYYPLEAIDKQPGRTRAFFIFNRNEQLDQLIETYWKNELRVSPQVYFASLRSIKARLYE